MPFLDVYPLFDHPVLRIVPLVVCLLYYLHTGACFLHLALADCAAAFGLVTFNDLYGWSVGWITALTFTTAYPYAEDSFAAAAGDSSSAIVTAFMIG
eukprot:2707436-Prymnesium_polylepis.2